MDLTLLEKQLNLKNPLYNFSILQTELLFSFSLKIFLVCYYASQLRIQSFSQSISRTPRALTKPVRAKSLLLSKWCQYRLPAILAGHAFWEHPRSPLPLCAVVRVQRGFSGRGTLLQSCPAGSPSPNTPQNSLKKGKNYFNTTFSGICFLTAAQLKGHSSAAGHCNCFKPLYACLIEKSENSIFPQQQLCFLRDNYIAP